MTDEQFVKLVRNRATRHPLVEETSQVHVRIVSIGSDDIESIRETIVEKLYDSVEEGWKENRSQLTLKCLIPPQAKPHGFRDRDDLPNQMQLTIAASESQPRMTTDGEPIPSLALIMKGGGIKGLAYVGALDLLRDEYDFSWYVGTSAGAITAILLAAGYDVEELQEILESKDFNDFFDAGLFEKPFNFLTKGGLHTAKAFTDWMDVLLADKLKQRSRVMLGDIERETGNRITVYASQQRKKALTFDSTDKPDVAAAYAARCSMSIPLIFTPEKEQGIAAFDGGLQNNFPIRQIIEDHGEVPFKSLFLGADTFEPIPESSLIWKVFGTILGQGEDEYVEEHKEHTVVIDPRPVGTLAFDLVDDEKKYLVTCGQIGALKHLLPTHEQDEDPELAEAIEAKKELRVTAEKMEAKRSRKRWFLIIVVVILVLVFAVFSYEALRRVVNFLWGLWFNE